MTSEGITTFPLIFLFLFSLPNTTNKKRVLFSPEETPLTDNLSYRSTVIMLKSTASAPESQISPLASLPCLFSNISTETPDKASLSLIETLCDCLSPYWKKSAHTLYSNVSRLISLAPSIGHVGFLTLTFADNVTDHHEAYDRFRSFNSHFLAKYPEISHWISVKERQKRGAWHYHLLVVLKSDIGQGVDFAQFKDHNYSSANNYLRFLWRDIREACSKYNLGRSELLPIKSNSEGMSRYLGKYISKHLNHREKEDKGVRLVNASRNWSKNSVNFAWYTEGSVEWRRKLALFAEYHGCTELYQLTEKMGTGWAYKNVDDIWNIDTIIEQANHTPIAHISNTVKILNENKRIFERSRLITKHRKKQETITEQDKKELITAFLETPEQKQIDFFLSDPAFKEKTPRTVDYVF